MEQQQRSKPDAKGLGKAWRTFYKRTKLFLPAICVLLVLFIYSAVVTPTLYSLNGISTMLLSASLLIVPALAQGTVISGGNTGIDLSVGPIMSLTALVAPAITKDGHVFVIASFLVCVAIGLCFGVLNGALIKALRMPPMVMTLITGYVISGFTWWVMHGNAITNSLYPLTNVSKIVVQPIRLLTLIVIIFVVLMQLMLSYSRFGKSLVLVGSNAETARLSGIKTDFIRISSYAISGMISGFGGMLLIGYTGASGMNMATSYTMLSVAAAVIGGTKLSGGIINYVSICLGALCLIMLNSILQAMNMAEGMRIFCQGLLLAIILMINNRSPKLRS